MDRTHDVLPHKTGLDARIASGCVKSTPTDFEWLTFYKDGADSCEGRFRGLLVEVRQYGEERVRVSPLGRELPLEFMI